MMKKQHPTPSRFPAYLVFSSLLLLMTGIQCAYELLPMEPLLLLSTASFIWIAVTSYSRLFRGRDQEQRESIRLSFGFVLSILVFFAALYKMIYLYQPSFFKTEDPAFGTFLYYSVTTFTSTGYGDIYPTHALTKFAAGAEMLLGWFISTLLIGLPIATLYAKVKGRNGEKRYSAGE